MHATFRLTRVFLVTVFVEKTLDVVTMETCTTPYFHDMTGGYAASTSGQCFRVDVPYQWSNDFYGYCMRGSIYYDHHGEKSGYAMPYRDGLTLPNPVPSCTTESDVGTLRGSQTVLRGDVYPYNERCREEIPYSERPSCMRMYMAGNEVTNDTGSTTKATSSFTTHGVASVDSASVEWTDGSVEFDEADDILSCDESQLYDDISDDDSEDCVSDDGNGDDDDAIKKLLDFSKMINKDIQKYFGPKNDDDWCDIYEDKFTQVKSGTELYYKDILKVAQNGDNSTSGDDIIGQVNGSSMTLYVLGRVAVSQSQGRMNVSAGLGPLEELFTVTSQDTRLRKLSEESLTDATACFRSRNLPRSFWEEPRPKPAPSVGDIATESDETKNLL